MGRPRRFHANLYFSFNGALHIFYYLEVAIARPTIRAFFGEVAEPSVRENSCIKTS